MKQLSNRWILFLILMVAVVLRVFNLSEIPFTHDEFSALSRLNFDSFSALIHEGVKIDGHPAGVQVFLYYWTKIFGISTIAVKFPFIIAGVISVYLTFSIGEKWMNETVGLISAATVSCLQYTVLFSQIARPYISGLFFSLLMVFFLTKLIQHPKRNFLLNGCFFIISGALCAYNHHFSLLFAAIVGVSGLFFIQKAFLIRYCLLGLGIFGLYIPHLEIFFYQLNVAGVEEWLAKPTPVFFLNYISYIFNYSYIFIMVVLGIALGFLVTKKHVKINLKNYLLFLTWFLTPLLIGYFYSTNVNAVLQYSVLIFSFTYLLFLLFGHLPNCSPKTNLILVALILLTGTLSLVYERQHYKYFYQSPYLEILNDLQVANEKENVLSVVQSVEHINAYYMNQMRFDSNYTWYDQFESIPDFKQFLIDNAEHHSYFYLGCLHHIDPLVVPIIQEFYPSIELQKNYFGGSSYLFSKNPSPSKLVSTLGFEKDSLPSWSYNTSSIIDTVSYAGKRSYQINPDEEWGPGFEANLGRFLLKDHAFIDLSVKIKANQPPTATLVLTLENEGETILWRGYDFDQQLNLQQQGAESATFHGTIEIPKEHLNNPNLKFKTYIWNKDKNTFLVEDYKIKLRKGNPIIYGIVNKL